MSIQEIVQKLKISKASGFQLEKKIGILTLTRLIYKKNEYYYYFDINQKIEFTDEYKYSENEILNELKNYNFIIDIPIS